LADAPEPIDAVCTWTDAGPPVSLLPGKGAAVDAHVRRYRDNDELRYSLRSLEQFAPWVRCIHLVTDGSAPSWLNHESERIRVVPHSSIFRDPGVLPSFNSNAIEMNLHRIPELPPKFLYLNDDVFLGRPLRPDYFRRGGADLFFLDADPWPTLRTGPDVHDYSYERTARLVAEFTGRSAPPGMPAHVPQLYDRDALAALEQCFAEEFQRTSSRRLRSREDFVLRLAYAGTRIGKEACGHVLPWGTEGQVLLRLYPRPLDAIRRLLAIWRWRPQFFCLNDDLDEGFRSRLVLKLVRRFLRAYFPKPSSFERRS